jgi:hypothetical protein
MREWNVSEETANEMFYNDLKERYENGNEYGG